MCDGSRSLKFMAWGGQDAEDGWLEDPAAAGAELEDPGKQVVPARQRPPQGRARQYALPAQGPSSAPSWYANQTPTDQGGDDLARAVRQLACEMACMKKCSMQVKQCLQAHEERFHVIEERFNALVGILTGKATGDDAPLVQPRCPPGGPARGY